MQRREKRMNDVIWYGDGTPKEDTGNKVLRNTRLSNLISQEAKDRWKQEEEERLKPKKELSEEELAENYKLRKTNLKDMTIEKEIDPKNVYMQQAKEKYERVKNRVLSGETISSHDEDVFSIPELQQKLRIDGIATIITLPTKSKGYTLRKM